LLILTISISLGVLDVQEHLDHIISNSLEGLVSDSSADDGDSFNHLSTELFVFRLAELSEELGEHGQSLVEIGYECFFSLFSTGSKSGGGVLFKHRHTILDEQEELLANNLTVRQGDFFCAVLKEVGKSGAGVCLNTRYSIIKSLNESRDDSSVEGLLEVIRHIIGELTDSMSRCVSDLRVGVLEVLEQDRYHAFDLFSFIDVLTDLRESHNSSVLVSPVRLVSHGASN
jgi:hypothetical protein